MRLILNKLRYLLRRLLGVSEDVVYKSDWPDGKLIGRPKEIGRFSLIDYGGGVKIGKNVKIGYGVIILSYSTITGSSGEKTIRKQVVIGDNVEIGSNSVILPGVTIGENSTIGAGAVVNIAIPPNSVAVGVPATVVKKKMKK
jgi:acetyltransferase-like isoleucine patch superfamily enzyme